jgi:neutral amino acid transport system permease protein
VTENRLAAPGVDPLSTRTRRLPWHGVAADPRLLFGAVLGAAVVALIVAYGVHALAQVTVNGVVAGTYFALGAVGLTLLYGVLRLVNFAHGDYMTLGAYVTVPALAGGLSFAPAAALGVLATGVAALALEVGVWSPLRRRGARMLQSLLTGIGIAFVIRYTIQLVAGPDVRTLHVDVSHSYSFLSGLRIGRTQLVVVVVGYAVLVCLACALKFTWTGKQLRALSDSRDLAESTGLDTRRLTLLTQFVAGALAGLAGVLFGAALGAITPDFGFVVLLNLFAAVVLGGIGSVFGALAAGITLGLMQEWSTLVVGSQWKLTVGFVVLVVVLLVRPEGIFGARGAVR